MSAPQIGVVILAAVALAAMVVFWLHRRSSLPSHLRPHFRSSAELHAFVLKQRSAHARRREELTEPATAAEAAEYLSLHGYDATSSTFKNALQMVEAGLKDDPCDYGQLLGEIYAFSRTYRNPEKAYYHYFIGLSQSGYSVGFRDTNRDPPHYCGPVGDFRNEAQVSELVSELGWDRIARIDLRAREWLAAHGLEVKEFLDEGQDPTQPSTATE